MRESPAGTAPNPVIGQARRPVRQSFPRFAVSSRRPGQIAAHPSAPGHGPAAGFRNIAPAAMSARAPRSLAKTDPPPSANAVAEPRAERRVFPTQQTRRFWFQRGQIILICMWHPE
jgi:hypothetical protein